MAKKRRHLFLFRQIWDFALTTEAVGDALGVTPGAVRRYAKNLGLVKHRRARCNGPTLMVSAEEGWLNVGWSKGSFLRACERLRREVQRFDEEPAWEAVFRRLWDAARSPQDVAAVLGLPLRAVKHYADWLALEVREEVGLGAQELFTKLQEDTDALVQLDALKEDIRLVDWAEGDPEKN